MGRGGEKRGARSGGKGEGSGVWGPPCPPHIFLPSVPIDLYLSEVSTCLLCPLLLGSKHNHQRRVFMSDEISLMYKENNKGSRRVSCGTPDKTRAQSDFAPFTTTRCCL